MQTGQDARQVDKQFLYQRKRVHNCLPGYINW